MKLTISILAGCSALLAATAASPQAKPSFDGRWTGQSIQCFPAAGQNRFTHLDVKDNKFSLRFTFDGRPQTCNVSIGPDGSFDNKSCDLPTSGKITGDAMELNYKSADRICKVALKREQGR